MLMNEKLTQAVAVLALVVSIGVAVSFSLDRMKEPQVPTVTDEEIQSRAFQTAVYNTNGGDKLVVASGGELEVQSGGTLDLQSGATTDFSGGVDLDGSILRWDADGNTKSQASDNVITHTVAATTGFISVITGNLRVGNGTPGTTQDGEDFYVEGGSEFDGAANFDGAVDVDGATTLNSTLDADGATTLNSTLDVDGNISSGTGALTFTTNIYANSFLVLGEASVVEATSAGTITPTASYQPITSSAVITLGTTAIADGSVEGQYLCLVNENASDTIAISDGQNTALSGNTVLGSNDTLCAIWNGADWVEVAQVDN